MVTEVSMGNSFLFLFLEDAAVSGNPYKIAKDNAAEFIKYFKTGQLFSHARHFVKVLANWTDWICEKATIPTALEKLKKEAAKNSHVIWLKWDNFLNIHFFDNIDKKFENLYCTWLELQYEMNVLENICCLKANTLPVKKSWKELKKELEESELSYEHIRNLLALIPGLLEDLKASLLSFVLIKKEINWETKTLSRSMVKHVFDINKNHWSKKWLLKGKFVMHINNEISNKMKESTERKYY
jgi:hypothetical protein